LLFRNVVGAAVHRAGEALLILAIFAPGNSHFGCARGVVGRYLGSDAGNVARLAGIPWMNDHKNW
jgi:hypothetical protein